MIDLPTVIPVFPLPNAVLFPGVPLPLHVFEPRYRTMVRDAQASDERVIGMVLLRGDWRKEYYGSPDVFPVGCAGRVVSIEELADGRYNILLRGLREFEIQSEVRDREYRRAVVTWHGDGGAALAADLRKDIRELMRRFLGNRGLRVARRLLDDASVSDDLLVNFLCFALDFSPIEKQALLEARSLPDRGARLCDIVRFALEAKGARSPGDDSYH
jgi:Lon protease-like protein